MAALPRPSILGIAPYVGGELAVRHATPARLMSNEGALGPSPLALVAYQQAASTLSVYPQGDSRELRQALALRHGLEDSTLIASNGSDELISLLCYAYSGPGDEVLYSRHGFLVYPIAAQAAGATPVTAPETDYTADVEALLKAVTPRTRLVFLANPNNPTATYVGRAALRRLRENLPPHILLVLDAAYGEFATEDDYTYGHDMVREYGNVVVLRTFSKAFALAGVRLGWGHFPPAVADILNRIRPPFNVSRAAQAAGIAALADTAHYNATIAHNTQWRAQLAAELPRRGYPVLPSQANFLAMKVGGEAETLALYEALCAQGVYLRRIKAYGLSGFLRLTVGDAAALTRFLAVLPGR